MKFKFKLNFYKIEWLTISNIKRHLQSIFNDIKDGKFMIRRWHLHALAFPLTILANVLMLFSHNIETTNWFLMIFRSLYETGIIGSFLIQSIIGVFISYSVEMWQSIVYGANKTPEEIFESNKDALFSIICFELGIIVSLFLFY